MKDLLRTILGGGWRELWWPALIYASVLAGGLVVFPKLRRFRFSQWFQVSLNLVAMLIVMAQSHVEREEKSLMSFWLAIYFVLGTVPGGGLTTWLTSQVLRRMDRAGMARKSP